MAAITATGGLADIDIGNFTRTMALGFAAKSSAGTNPTLDLKWQNSAPAVAGYSFSTAGASDNKLKAGASTTVKLGAFWTQSGAKSLKSGLLMLTKIGTITAGKKVTVEVYADTTGAPSGSALASTTIDIDTAITTDYLWVPFTFTTPLDVADATVYHLVLSADYTASASNCVEWRNATVASGGNFETYDATNWTATGTKSFEVILQQYTFTDIAGGTTTQVTTTASRQEVAFAADTPVSRIVRPYCTIGGTSTPTFYTVCYVNAENRTS